MLSNAWSPTLYRSGHKLSMTEGAGRHLVQRFRIGTFVPSITIEIYRLEAARQQRQSRLQQVV